MDSPTRRPHSLATLPVAVCAVAAIAALAGGGWWLLRSGEAARHAATASRANETAHAQVDVAAEAAESAAQEAVRENGVQSFTRAPACVVGPEDGVAVHVVAKEGPTGVEGARVYVVPVDEGGTVDGRSRATRRMRLQSSWLESATWFLTDPGRLADVEAHGFLADAHGDARVEWPDGGVMLVGFAEGLRGVLGLSEKPDASIELALAKPEDRRVEVVTRDGKPIAGARVELARWWSSDGKRVAIPIHDGALTDGSGRARLVGCEIARESQRIPGMEDAALVVNVPILGLDAGSATSPLPPPSNLDEVVRITVGEPFGVVEVHAVDANGRSPDGEALLQALEPAESSDDNSSWLERIQAQRFRRRRFDRGVARVVPVALHQRLRVALVGPTFSAAPKVVLGPAVDGETVRVDVTAMKESQSVRGRLVGIAAPLGPDARFLVALGRVGASELRYGRLEASLEEGASFHVVVPSNPFRDSRQLVFEVTPRDHSAAYRGTIPLEGLPDDDEVDVGDVVATPLAALVTGRVVDESGRPVADVAVEVTSATRRRFGNSDDTSNPVKTDGAGRFAWFGGDDGTDFVLAATPPRGLLGVRIPVEPGARDLEVVVLRTGAIVGTVECRRPATLFARPIDGGDAIPEVPLLREEGVDVRAFRIEVPPGRYDVVATLDHQSVRDELFARVGGVAVLAGETTTDPRLSPLVVRDQDFEWRVEVARSDGGPAPSAWICLAPVDAPNEYLRTAYCATGTAEFHAALESAWVDVYAASFRRVHQLCNPGTVAITLEPVEQDDVAFELAVDASAELSKLEFLVAVDQVPPLPGFLGDSYTSPIAAGATARVSIDRGPHWKARLFVLRSGAVPDGVRGSFELTRMARDVAAGSDPIRFDVSAGDVEQARARLLGRPAR